MLEGTQAAVIVPLSAWLVYSLVRAFGQTRKLDHIPSIGFSDPILSYWSALQFLIDPIGFLRRGWETIQPGTKFVKVPGLTRWIVMPAVPEQYKEVAGAPDRSLSFDMAGNEFLQGEFTMYFKEIGDGLQIGPIRHNLTRSLGDLLPSVHEEAVLALEDAFPLKENEWKSYVFMPSLLKVVTRISNRVLVGLPLCRDPEYIDSNVHYATAVFVESYLLSILPYSLRGYAHRLFSPIPGIVDRMTNWMQPLIDARREEKAKLGQSWEQPQDVLSWLMDIAEERGRADRDPIIRIMSLNFGSIHTTSITFTNALYSLLSRPQYIDPLREEINQCIQEEGWTKAALDKMILLDGFLKESMRLDFFGVYAGGRMAVEDCTVSGIPIPKGTLVTASLVDGHLNREIWGPDGDEFDPYRFINMEKETGRRITSVTTSISSLTFGHGRHACPGRFFATQEMKLMLALFLQTYDMKLDNKDGARPKNMWVGLSCVPNQSASIMFRKRARV
ncbi:hypothetical protein D9611_008153 [Ephemerocybe angulata]|uniref:Cytochrome P450 n=1 Tax=Ephemerocybe angulata TaxID=980116 RepID=A0A8H5FCV8_9AGAR|nr:hypothetical protein D9611_008153 [Tulosesus angulatus]